MRLKQQQYGMGMLGWLFVILVFGICFTIGARLLPLYAENRYVVESLKNLAQTPGGVENMSRREIEGSIYKFYSMNNVHSEGAKNIEVEYLTDRALVSINYEVRVPMFYNVDAVVSFNNELDSKFPGECCNSRAE